MTLPSLYHHLPNLPLPTLHMVNLLIIIRKVRTPSDAQRAYHVALAHLPYAERKMRPRLLIVVAYD